MTTPKIMLVDDETSFTKTMGKRLGKRNIETLAASSGKECLEKLKANQNLDVIVLDVKMPGMDGIETLKEIRMLSPLTEVILLTGNASIESGIQGMKLGAYDYLMKPCDIDELVTKIREATEKKRIHEEKIDDWGRFMDASTLEELIVPLNEYATVSEQANVLEAVNALEEAQKSFHPRRYRHRAVIVLDEAGRVVGKLNQHDIIRALEPQYKGSAMLQTSAHNHFGFSRTFIESTSMQYLSWDRPLQNLYKKALDQKVKSIMHIPTEGEYIDETATINETIHRLITGEHQSLLVRRGSEIIGIVRLTDVFELIHLRLKTLHLVAQIESRTNKS